MGFGDQFLTEPALFPARLAGEPGGEADLALDLPGGPYAIRGLGEAQLELLGERYGERCLEPVQDGVGVEVRLFRAQPAEFLEIERPGWINAFDFEYREDSVDVAGNRVMARLMWRPRLTAAIWTAWPAGAEFLEAFENCLRIVSAYRLLELGGTVLHSSCVVNDGRAWVFYGPSGAGKTTVARRALDGGRLVLSDDINAVVLADGEPRVEKMPFAGELGHSNDKVGPYPLAALSRLEQAEREAWRPLSPAAAVGSLVSCAPFVNADPHRLPAVMDALEELVRSARTGVLEFTLTGDPWSALEVPTT